MTFTSTDGGALLPADTPLVAGTLTLNATFSEAGGQLFWFLVVGVNGGVEGSGGNATPGPRIVNSTGSCP